MHIQVISTRLNLSLLRLGKIWWVYFQHDLLNCESMNIYFKQTESLHFPGKYQIRG